MSTNIVKGFSSNGRDETGQLRHAKSRYFTCDGIDVGEDQSINHCFIPVRSAIPRLELTCPFSKSSAPSPFYQGHKISLLLIEASDSGKVSDAK